MGRLDRCSWGVVCATLIVTGCTGRDCPSGATRFGEYCAVPCASVPGALCSPDGAVLTDASADVVRAGEAGDAESGDVVVDADASSGPAAPRQIAPLSTSRATSQRPAFRWALAPDTDGARIELCRDRAMTSGCIAVDATGSGGQTAAPMAQGVWFWRVRGKAGSAVGTDASSVWELDVSARDAPVNSSWGSSLDLNGDGAADTAVASSHGFAAGGQVFVYMGGAHGTASTPSVTLNDPSGTGDAFGFVVGSLGDVNGDGYADLGVGQYGSVSGTGGALYVYFGSPVGVTPIPGATLHGSSATDVVAVPFAAAGDLNTDGYGDLVALAFEPTDGGVGPVHIDVFLGSARGPGPTPAMMVPGTTSGLDGLQTSLAAGGDLDGDGRPDVVVGDPSAGSVRIYPGTPGGMTFTPSVTLSRPAGSAAYFGTSVAIVGDNDGDGVTDLAVTAPGAATEAGAVHRYPGSRTGVAANPQMTLTAPDGAGTGFGGLALLGHDLNNDGYDDLVVGAAGAHTHGAAYVYAGGASSLLPTVWLEIDAPEPTIDSEFGQAVVAADVDGDGYTDLTVGAPGAAGDTGRAYVYLHSTDGLSATPLPLMPPTVGSARALFGSSLAMLWTPTDAPAARY